MERAEYAKGIFVHYIRMCMEASGLKPDAAAEIEGAVDNLLDAAKNEQHWHEPESSGAV